MHRVDNSQFLLYIEPPIEAKEKISIDDSLTKIMEYALSKAKAGTANYSDLKNPPRFDEGSGWKGMHITACGEMSQAKDFLLENGMITNSLAPFYLRWYRDYIPASEIEKVKKLLEFYDNKSP